MRTKQIVFYFSGRKGYRVSLSTTIIIIITVSSFWSHAAKRPAHPNPITQLKNMSIQTDLVADKRPEAVLILPSGQAFSSFAKIINSRIKSLAGVELPIVDANIAPEKLLAETHVVALGNMTNNAFIRSMYIKWYTFLDLQYPGPGGYEVRSLHNPFGTGKNVVFVGGSDIAGVAKASSALADKLVAGKPLSVGWLMDIHLGNGMNPPVYSPDHLIQPVYSWHDSWRGQWSFNKKNRKGHGYQPASYFGWNPISVAGALYYMTGRVEYVQALKKMIFFNPNGIPKRLLTDEAFDGTEDPLVKSYHYRAHLLDLIWDLIEESPLFNEKERLYITNKLLDHQYYLDPKHVYSKVNPGRHGAYHMLCIYSGSRYFQKSYPDLIWDRRIGNVRKGFRSFIGDPTWGERDTLEWVSTSIEPVVDFFLMDGPEDFVDSHMAKNMSGALDILFTGNQNGLYTRYTSVGLLHKASFLLNDLRYAWMARRLGFDLGVFRIGQSFWPAGEIPAAPPADMIGTVKSCQLAKTDWENSGITVPYDESFQIAAYRTGTGPKDDYLLFDGFAGLGRDSYHLAAIRELRLFGRKVLTGEQNDVDVLFNGMVEPAVPRAAALKRSFGEMGIAYLHTQVPDLPGSSWDRQVLVIPDEALLVADEVMANQAGDFDVGITWRFGARLQPLSEAGSHVMTRNGIKALTSWVPYQQTGDSTVAQAAFLPLEKGEKATVLNLFVPAQAMMTVAPLTERAFAVRGMRQALVSVGPFASSGITVNARFAYADAKRLLLDQATVFHAGGKAIFEADQPVLVNWDFVSGKAVVFCRQPSRVRFCTVEGKAVAIEAGQTTIEAVWPDKHAIRSFLAHLSNTALASTGEAVGQKTSEIKTGAAWHPQWTLDFKWPVTDIDSALAGEQSILCAATNGPDAAVVAIISSDGKILGEAPVAGKVTALWGAKTPAQSARFACLTGDENDRLTAFSATGKSLWCVTTQAHPSFRVGQRYQAPWFTSPEPPHRKQGIYTIHAGDFWGDGAEQVAIGRPSTVSLFTPSGGFVCSAPVQWGDVASLFAIQNAGKERAPWLLAAKIKAGHPYLTAIDQTCAPVSDSAFNKIPEGYTQMHAWLQRGTPQLAIEDIDGNGTEEVIYTLSGHWNELRVYDGQTMKPRWMHYFGPGQSNTDFMRGLVVADLDLDGKKEVVTATQVGWLFVFGHDGALKAKKRFDSGIARLGASDAGNGLAIGLDNGTLLIIGPDWQTMWVDDQKTSINALHWIGGAIYAGAGHVLTKYNMR